MANRYQHTQPGTVIRVFIGSTVILMVVLAFFATQWLLVPAALLLGVYVFFHSLTVDIDEGDIHIALGIGVIHRSIPLANISSCQVVRTPWYFGWGIRYVFNGWMWNVSGLYAVELTYTNGGHFRIGTDEPDALAAAIEECITGTL